MLKYILFLSVALLALGDNCTVQDAKKLDCGHVGTNQQQCESAGCCWSPINPNPNNYPWCYYGSNHPSPQPPKPGNSSFSADEIAKMQNYFLQNVNIGGKGGVVAAPDTNTAGGSYYFHWMRDGAITMNVVHTVVRNFDLMKSYVNWVKNAQQQSDPHGIDVRGEPKFMLPNGEVFTGGWCRPQNDGAGLRANTLSQFALELIQIGQRDYALNSIWPLVQKDCEYVISAWTQTSNDCDLWEEIRGEMFFNLMSQRKGLLIAAKLAQLFGDSNTAGNYRAVAQQIQGKVDGHWDGNILFEATNRRKDSAVILAVLYGYADDGYLSFSDPKVVSTVDSLNQVFATMFAINGKDDAAGIPGILWGRYQGDSYAGGNPWVLNTAALADVYFRQAIEVLRNARQGNGLTADQSRAFGKLLLGSEGAAVGEAEAVARQLASMGEGVLFRIRVHVQPLDFHLPEQVDRNTGAFANVHDLTWSYGSVLLALHTRQQWLAML